MVETQKQAEAASHLTQELGITTEQPTETGMWLCSCDENNGEWTSVIISTGRNCELMATETIGTYPLDAYHSNLTNIRWRKLGLSKQESIDVSRQLAESIRNNDYTDMPLIEA